ncbi:BON domain-containing protein [Variovorax sp. WS11]|uniref:BON domain-containing protein n=1 Tax=Variovorax sp. WS11 TaxID=1105204 RepID=UPI000D0CCFC5|nr:BON domain-containing protein [Variovorax sp. WS11]NDZ18441.1 BON domain-containing protein [Variovorax sp. WS11]
MESALKGEVEWAYQRNAAMQAVRSLTSVLGLSNDITLKPNVMSANVLTRIREALAWHAEQEAQRIGVLITGATATLRGTVQP